MKANPIRRWKPIRVGRPRHGVAVYTVSYAGPWVAHCPDCTKVIPGCRSRKVAKDRLHQHRKAEHR